jgi:hypothetical protein
MGLDDLTSRRRRKDQVEARSGAAVFPASDHAAGMSGTVANITGGMSVD